ncbi:hypothetical protein LO763_20150 [Glycomyces sp. A-F 0318]|uniref:hypothetical protein n=1 Tax=Glycomyces amatae TaxID=2881355 RepID=UPI001E446115|nr:hypothetical protein [Glycomyces amatae]MCD0445927.1 hypothetical protein [Glycomyces amatae]
MPDQPRPAPAAAAAAHPSPAGPAPAATPDGALPADSADGTGRTDPGPHAWAGARIIDEFTVEGVELAVECTGRLGNATLVMVRADDRVEPVVSLDFNPADGRLRDARPCGIGHQYPAATITDWTRRAQPILTAFGTLTGTIDYQRLQHQTITNLMKFRLPVPEAVAALDAVAPSAVWSYTVTREEVVEAWFRCQVGLWTGHDLRTWAQAVLERDDIRPAAPHASVIESVLRDLVADPERFDSRQAVRDALGFPAPAAARRGRALLGLVVVALAGASGGHLTAAAGIELGVPFPVVVLAMVALVELAVIGRRWRTGGLAAAILAVGDRFPVTAAFTVGVGVGWTA